MQVYQTKYLIIGGSAAGISAANTLAKLDAGAQILCVTAEPVQPYNKCFLVDWLAGEKSRQQLDLVINPNVTIWTGLWVISLDPINKIAYLSNNTSIIYQKALLAIGAHAFKPKIDGLDAVSHVFNFHDYHDVEQLAIFIKNQQPKRAVVIGAGLTGLECADALWRCGLNVAIIERSAQVLGKLVDQVGAAKLTSLIVASGVDLYLNASVTELGSEQVILDSNISIPADLVVLAVGVRPNGLKIINQELAYYGQHLQVDACLQTNLPDVWAAGDMIAVPEILTGQITPSCSWPDAMLQGNYAAQNMAGRQNLYPGMLAVANSHFFGQDLISFGVLDQKQPDLNLAYRVNHLNQSYQMLVLDQQKYLKGAVLIGDTTLYPALKRAVMINQPWAI